MGDRKSANRLPFGRDGGTRSMLSRPGVSFSSSEEKTIKCLVEAGRMAEAQQIILKKLATEFKDS